MPELALDHYERDTFVRHLDRMCVTQLVWRETASHARRGGLVMVAAIRTDRPGDGKIWQLRALETRRHRVRTCDHC